MPKTPNREHGELQVDSIVIEQTGADRGPVPPGGLRFVDGKFTLHDTHGDYDPRYGAIDETQHDGLDTLAHAIAETAYTEITRVNGRIESIVIWADATRTKKVRETVVTRDSNRIARMVVRQYDLAGAVKQTLTSDITRDAQYRVANIQSTKT